MNRIKELRNEKGLTQCQLASLLGINQTAVGKYERGELEPNFQNLIKISHIFECSVDYIICNSDDIGNIVIPTATPSALRLSDREKKLLSAFNRLPEGLQDRTLAYVEDLGEAISPNLQKKSSGI